MADVSLYLPDPEQSRIKRGQRMAALLQQQAQAPVEAQSYGGIPAPISPLNGLAKALAGFGSAYVERDAEKREEALGEKYRTEASDWAKALQGTPKAAPNAEMADVADREQGMQMGSGAQPLSVGQPVGPATVTPPSNDFLRQMAVQGMTNTNPLIRSIAPTVFSTAEKRDEQAAALAARRADKEDANNQAIRMAAYREQLRRDRPTTSGGAFGNSLQGRAHDILLAPDADPSSPNYRAAYAILAAPQTTFDSTTGQMIQRQPDMSAYRPPSAAQAGAPQAPAQAASAAPVSDQPPVPAPAAQAPGQPTITTQQVANRPPPQQFNENQGKAAGFADRMSDVENILSDPQILMQGTDLQGRMLESVPGGIGNYGQNPRYQQFVQARDNFINAQLRRESGAAISPSEYANADKQYFPKPGDSPQVIAQKNANRKAALGAMAREAGSAYQPKEPTKSKTVRFEDLP